MGKLYNKGINSYKKWFKEAAEVLGVDVKYRYIIKRKAEVASGESIYSNLSEPIIQSVIIEEGLPKVESLKQLGWFVDTNNEQLLVDFPVDTPNLQEGCRFTLESSDNKNQTKEYLVTKLSSTQLYPSCIKCLCIPVLENETNVDDKGNILYGQQEIISDEENYSFINEEPTIKMF